MILFIAGDVILGKVAANIYADVQEEAKTGGDYQEFKKQTAAD
jgi:hypothetical protein